MEGTRLFSWSPSARNIQVLIPARSGSKSIMDKNLAEIGGVSLLELAIAAARQIFPAEQVWVSTDSDEYAERARSSGADVPFLRPATIATDTATDLDVFRHASAFAAAKVQRQIDVWIHLRPTSPIREVYTLRQVIDHFMKSSPQRSALRSIHASPLQVLKWCLREKGGRLTSLAGDRQLDLINRPRQSYAQVFIPNGYIDILLTRTITSGSLLGDNVEGFITKPTTDIDTTEDLDIARSEQHLVAPLIDWICSRRNA